MSTLATKQYVDEKSSGGGGGGGEETKVFYKSTNGSTGTIYTVPGTLDGISSDDYVIVFFNMYGYFTSNTAKVCMASLGSYKLFDANMNGLSSNNFSAMGYFVGAASYILGQSLQINYQGGDGNPPSWSNCSGRLSIKKITPEWLT